MTSYEVVKALEYFRTGEFCEQPRGNSKMLLSVTATNSELENRFTSMDAIPEETFICVI